MSEKKLERTEKYVKGEANIVFLRRFLFRIYWVTLK